MRRSVNRAEYPYILECLVTVRRAAGLTQVQLAAKMESTQAYISSIERSFRRIDLMQTFLYCEACSVTMEQFGAMLDRAVQAQRSEPVVATPMSETAVEETLAPKRRRRQSATSRKK